MCFHGSDVAAAHSEGPHPVVPVVVSEALIPPMDRVTGREFLQSCGFTPQEGLEETCESS